MNRNKHIFISTDDYNRLNRIINDFIRQSKSLPGPVRLLQGELQRAALLEDELMPSGVISLYSRVELLDLESREKEEWTLTLPEHANFDRKRLSILAPLGTAILGYSVGDEIEWERPGGTRKVRIERVERNVPVQPEMPESLFG